MTDTNQPLFIVFIDALDANEIPATGFLANTHQTNISSPVLNVTPCILGPALTGEHAGYHNLIRPTRLYDGDVQRPACDHFIEEISDEQNVFAHNIPMTGGVEPQSGSIFPSAPRTNVNVQTPHLQVTRGDFSLTEVAKGNEDVDSCFNATVDYLRQYFANVRNLARNGTYDVFFLSIRDLDSFTHFYDAEIREGLIAVLEDELTSTVNMGSDEPLPLLWFSDHGCRPMTDCFRINQWLREHDYLDLDIHMDEWRRNGGPESEVSQQIDIHSPFVQIENESNAYSCDAFDATIDVLEDTSESTVDSLITDLEQTNAFTTVYHKSDLYNEGTPHYSEIPAIIPQRKPGLMVSGNVHPDAPTWNGEIDAHGHWRTGVHRRESAVLGSTRSLDCPVILSPIDIYDVLTDFTDTYRTPTDQSTSERVTDQLDALGYI